MLRLRHTSTPLQVPQQLATIARKAGTDCQACTGSLALQALLLLLKNAAAQGLLLKVTNSPDEASSRTPQGSSSSPAATALAASFAEQLQLSGLVQQLPAVLHKAASEVQELRAAAQQQPLLKQHVSTFGINADFGKGHLVDALLRHAMYVLGTRTLLTQLWPSGTFTGLGASMLPAGRLAVLCLRYLSDVYNALPEQQMSIHLQDFNRMIMSCYFTATDLAHAASMPLYERSSQQASADVAQLTGDLDSSTAQQLLKDPCYLQCIGLLLALVAYRIIIDGHKSTYSSSEVEAHPAAGSDSIHQDNNPNSLRVIHPCVLQNVQEQMPSQQGSSSGTSSDSQAATNTAASALHSRLPQLHRQLLQELGFSSKLVAAVAASDYYVFSSGTVHKLCYQYSQYVQYMMRSLDSPTEQAQQQGQQQQQQQQLLEYTQAQQYAVVHVCLCSLLLSCAAKMPLDDRINDCYCAAVVAADGLLYWSYLQTHPLQAASASSTGRAGRSPAQRPTPWVFPPMGSPEAEQAWMAWQVQEDVKMALLPEDLAAQLTKETLPAVLHMITQLLPQLEAYGRSIAAATHSTHAAHSSSSRGGGGVCGTTTTVGGGSSGSELAGTNRQTKDSSLKAPPGTDLAVPAMPGIDSTSNATSTADSSSTDVIAAYAVTAVLECICQLAAHTSHFTQRRAGLCGRYSRGPEREPQVVAWDQHAAELALLLEQLVRLEAEQPGLLAAGSDSVRQSLSMKTAMQRIRAIVLGLHAGWRHIMCQLQDAAAVAAPGGVLQSRFCSLLASLFKYHSKHAATASAAEVAGLEEVASGVLSMLAAVGQTAEGFSPKPKAACGSDRDGLSPASGSIPPSSSPAELPGGNKRLSNMVPALNLLGRCMMFRGQTLQALLQGDAAAIRPAAQQRAAAAPATLGTTAFPLAAASSHRSEASDTPCAATAATTSTVTTAAAAAQQTALASDAGKAYLRKIGSNVLVSLALAKFWLPRVAGPCTIGSSIIPVQDQEVSAHITALCSMLTWSSVLLVPGGICQSTCIQV